MVEGMHRMIFEDLKRFLPEIAGKAPVWIDDCALAVVADETEIYLEYDRERDEVYLYCQVACLPPERLADHAVLLLEANLFGRDTGGSAVIAYDPEESKLVLWDKLPLPGLTRDEFRERFAYLYLSKKHWADKLRNEVLGKAKGQNMPFLFTRPSFFGS